MGTKETVAEYFKGVNRGDWDTLLTLFADDAVMDEQSAGHVEGVNTLSGAVGALFNSPQQGVPINWKGANFFALKDDKIAYMANSHDTVPSRPFTEQKLD